MGILSLVRRCLLVCCFVGSSCAGNKAAGPHSEPAPGPQSPADAAVPGPSADAAVPGPSADVAGGSEMAVESPVPGKPDLMHADFEKRGAGPYNMAMVAGDFGAPPRWNNGLDEGRATIVEEAGEHFLRVTYPAGQFGPNAGGVQFMVPLGGNHGELDLSYRVRFGAGFQFVKGGKLPGLVGGTAPTGCITDLVAIQGGFSARMMWRTGGAAVQYMYTPTRVNSCGDDLPYTVNGTASRFASGQWHGVRHHLRMNTPGQADGTVEAWFDGELALSRRNVLFRPTDGTFQIDTLYFSTFFGGSDTTWAPTSDQVVDFDDFVVTAP